MKQIAFDFHLWYSLFIFRFVASAMNTRLALLVCALSMAALTKAHSVPLQPLHELKAAPSKLASSIEEIQRKHAGAADTDDSIKTNDASGHKAVKSVEIAAEDNNVDDDELLLKAASSRRNKMLNGFYQQTPPYLYQQPGYYPPEFYNDFAAYMNDEEEVMSRSAVGSVGSRRRPVSQQKESQIFYIRLPPTPYMFVPGIGYVSQPPSYNPMMAPQPPVPSYSPPAPSPFYNLPLSFIGNGKPTNVYQWQGNQYGGYQPPYPNYQAPQYPNYNQFPNPHYQQSPPYQQFPQMNQYPQRPQRPYQRPPMNPYENSKIHNLKSQFLFNGRPDDVYFLPNFYNPMYSNPYY